MLVVVPLHERVYPGPCGRDVHERMDGVSRPILEGLEQRFGVRIVVADRRATQTCHDAECDHRRQHRGALHRAAVVGVQNNLARLDLPGAPCSARLLEMGGSGYDSGIRTPQVADHRLDRPIERSAIDFRSGTCTRLSSIFRISQACTSRSNELTLLERSCLWPRIT